MVYTRRYTKRQEAKKWIVEALKRKPMTQKELIDGTQHGDAKLYQSTISRVLKKLCEEGRVEKIKGGKYKWGWGDTADPKIIDGLIGKIENGSAEVKKVAIDDLLQICHRKKITKPQHLKFLMGCVKNTKGKENEKFFEALRSTVSNIRKEYNPKLNELLENTLDFVYFKKRLMDDDELMTIRVESWGMFEVMNKPNRYEIAFDLMESMDEKTEEAANSEGNFYSSTIVNTIIEYSKVKGADVNKKLYKLLEHEKPYVGKRADNLLRWTRLHRYGLKEKEEH